MTVLDLLFEGLPSVDTKFKGCLREKEAGLLLKWRKVLLQKIDVALSYLVLPAPLKQIIKRCLVF